MFYSNMRPVKRKRFSYVVNQFSVTLHRDNKRIVGERNYLHVVLMYLIENYAHLIVAMLNLHKYCYVYLFI